MLENKKIIERELREQSLKIKSSLEGEDILATQLNAEKLKVE